MARTLFFLEAILLLLGSGLLAGLGGSGFTALAVPAGVAILLPLASLCAIWSPRQVLRAFVQAFSPGRPGLGSADSLAILGALGEFAGFGGLAGAVGAGTVLLASLAAGRDPGSLAVQALAYGLFGTLYWISARILRETVDQALTPPGNGDLAEGMPAFAAKYGLSPREAEVAALMAGGRSYQEVADSLFISLKTVKTHISRVYEKTACPNKVSLVLLLRAESGESYERPMAERGGRVDA